LNPNTVGAALRGGKLEAIPEARRSGETNITTMAAMFGLAIMMVLDVGLG